MQVNLQKAMTDRIIEDIVTQIQREPADLTKFAFELRKFDFDDKYTFSLLNG